MRGATFSVAPIKHYLLVGIDRVLRLRFQVHVVLHHVGHARHLHAGHLHAGRDLAVHLNHPLHSLLHHHLLHHHLLLHDKRLHLIGIHRV